MTKLLTRVLVNLACIDTQPCKRWWDGAVAIGDSAPADLRRLLSGEDVIEVTEQAGREIRQWAEGINGWNEAADDQKPLLFQRTDRVGIV